MVASEIGRQRERDSGQHEALAGADRLLAMDLHSGQCVGYFDIPVDHVYGDSVLLEYLTSKRISTGELVVVSPDVGGVARARAFAKKLNDAPLAIVDKRRSAHNVSEVMNVIGEVKDKVAVLVDDMIDTAGTSTLRLQNCSHNFAPSHSLAGFLSIP